MIKVETIFDRGTVLFIEDYHLFQPPFAVVADGVSPPYDGQHPLRMVEGFTAGAMAARLVCGIFQNARMGNSAMGCLLRANERLGALQQGSGFSLEQPELLASASVVGIKLDDPVQIVQVGDAIALWRLKNGEKGATANLVYQHDESLHQAFAEIMARVQGNRQEAWEQYYEVRCAAVREHTNRSVSGGFSVINGQLGVVPLIREMRIPRCELSELIICSDGLVPFEMTKDIREFTEWFFRSYDWCQSGLKGVLKNTRIEEEKKSGQSHIQQTEATAIAIKFI